MPNNLHEVAKIMGVDEETLALLPGIQYERNMLNPWGDELLDIFGTLDAAPHKTLLDIPCGQGGVSVPLAKEYGVQVDGYDLFEGFIGKARGYAARQGVQNLCRFYAADIRAAIRKGTEYDYVLWSAAPHIWDGYTQAVENLRKCVKHGGYLIIADAYVYKDAYKTAQPGYETLEETLEAVTAHGDNMVKLVDYKDTLWAVNYKTDREAVARAIGAADTPREKEVLEGYLQEINRSEHADIECLGLYILVLQAAKE